MSARETAKINWDKGLYWILVWNQEGGQLWTVGAPADQRREDWYIIGHAEPVTPVSVGPRVHMGGGGG